MDYSKLNNIAASIQDVENAANIVENKLKNLIELIETVTSSSLNDLDDKINNSGFLTSHQDISGKANITDVYNKTQSDDRYLQKGSYAASSDLTSLSNKVGILENNIPTKVSDLTNDSGYLTQHQTLPGIVDDVSTNDATKVLSAKQGKLLNDRVTTLENAEITAEDVTYDSSETYTNGTVGNAIQTGITASAASATAASQSASNASGYYSDILTAMGNLGSGEAVAAQVAINQADIAELKTNVVVDLSTRYSTSYANLSAALTALNNDATATNIKKAGVSIKFINSSTNKYEQWVLKASSFSTTESDWVRLDNEEILNKLNAVISRTYHITKGAYNVNSGVRIQDDTMFSSDRIEILGKVVLPRLTDDRVYFRIWYWIGDSYSSYANLSTSDEVVIPENSQYSHFAVALKPSGEDINVVQYNGAALYCDIAPVLESLNNDMYITLMLVLESGLYNASTGARIEDATRWRTRIIKCLGAYAILPILINRTYFRLYFWKEDGTYLSWQTPPGSGKVVFPNNAAYFAVAITQGDSTDYTLTICQEGSVCTGVDLNRLQENINNHSIGQKVLLSEAGYYNTSSQNIGDTYEGAITNDANYSRIKVDVAGDSCLYVDVAGRGKAAKPIVFTNDSNEIIAMLSGDYHLSPKTVKIPNGAKYAYINNYNLTEPAPNALILDDIFVNIFDKLKIQKIASSQPDTIPSTISSAISRGDTYNAYISENIIGNVTSTGNAQHDASMTVIGTVGYIVYVDFSNAESSFDDAKNPTSKVYCDVMNLTDGSILAHVLIAGNGTVIGSTTSLLGCGSPNIYWDGITMHIMFVYNPDSNIYAMAHAVFDISTYAVSSLTPCMLGEVALSGHSVNAVSGFGNSNPQANCSIGKCDGFYYVGYNSGTASYVLKTSDLNNFEIYTILYDTNWNANCETSVWIEEVNKKMYVAQRFSLTPYGYTVGTRQQPDVTYGLLTRIDLQSKEIEDKVLFPNCASRPDLFVDSGNLYLLTNYPDRSTINIIRIPTHYSNKFYYLSAIRTTAIFKQNNLNGNLLMYQRYTDGYIYGTFGSKQGIRVARLSIS